MLAKGVDGPVWLIRRGVNERPCLLDEFDQTTLETQPLALKRIGWLRRWARTWRIKLRSGVRSCAIIEQTADRRRIDGVSPRYCVAGHAIYVAPETAADSGRAGKARLSEHDRCGLMDRAKSEGQSRKNDELDSALRGETRQDEIFGKDSRRTENF